MLKDDDPRNHERSNWRLERYELFYKVSSMCYPLILNWDKISCPYSSEMIGWSSRHNLPSDLFSPWPKNATFTKLSIFNHARTCKEDPIHFEIKACLKALNGINDIEKSTCTEQENQLILGIDPRWAQRSPKN